MGLLSLVDAVDGVQIFFALPGSHVSCLVHVGKHAGVIERNQRIQKGLTGDGLIAIGHGIIVEDPNPEFAGIIEAVSCLAQELFDLRSYPAQGSPSFQVSR